MNGLGAVGGQHPSVLSYAARDGETCFISHGFSKRQLWRHEKKMTKKTKALSLEEKCRAVSKFQHKICVDTLKRSERIFPPRFKTAAETATAKLMMIK